METNCYQTKSELFGVYTDESTLNFFPSQKIQSAIIKNEGNKTAVLYGQLTLRPNEVLELGNNNDIYSYRNDVISIEFTGTGTTQKIVVVVDKKVKK